MKHSPLLLILTVLCWCSFASFTWMSSNELTVRFLDIGQGDSILIQTPHGRTVLVDGGPGTVLLERLGEEMSWWQKSFDLVVLTHPDLDHLEGLLEVLKRYEVHRVLMTGADHSSALYRAFLEEIIRQNIPISVADPQQDWLLDNGVVLDILAPIEPVTFQEPDNANDASVVAKLNYGKTSLMLTGDIELEAEQALLASGADVHAQLLKAGHHGSVTSSSIPFLKAVQPEKAVFQAGIDNSFGHPHTETLLNYDELGIEWLSTHQQGTITYRSNGMEWRVNAR